MPLLVKILLAPFALVGAVLLLGAVATLVITLVVEARYPPQGRFVEVEGRRVHLVERGPPPGEAAGTVVLIHGASGNAADPLSALGDALAARRYRVVAVDRPGHGWSDRAAGPDRASPARQAEVIAEALRRAGVSRAVVVGHSWGGAVVPNLALDHRDVTGAILLLSAVTHPWPGGRVTWYYGPATSLLGWIFTRTLTAPVGWLFAERTLDAVFAPQAPEPGYIEKARIPLVLRPKVFQANAEDVAGLHDAVTRQKDRYRDIQVPATAVGGSADRIVSTDIHSRAFAREVPGAKLVVLDGIGHMPHFVAREAVLAEVEALAARIPASAPGDARALP